LTRSIDIFFCAAMPRMCELFAPFNRTIVSLGGMDLGAIPLSFDRFNVRWLHTYTALCLQPHNLCATTNAFYAGQYEYWTEIRPAVFRVFADFWTVAESERWRRSSRALVETRSVICFGEPALLRANEHARASGAKLALEWDDPDKPTRRDDPASFWVSFGAIVVCPYTFASIHFSELHTLAIPLFVPSIEYLSFMGETDNRLDQNYCSTYIRTHPPDRRGPHYPYSPTEYSRGPSMRFWNRLADMYQYPYVQTFSSLDDLVVQMSTADLPAISRHMRDANRAASELTAQRWQRWFEQRLSSTEPFGSERDTPHSFKEYWAARARYERLDGLTSFLHDALALAARTALVDSDEDPLRVAMLTHSGDEAYITVVARANLDGVADGSLFIASMAGEQAMDRTRFGACDGCSRSMAQFRARRQVGSTAPLHLRLFTVANGRERMISLFNMNWGDAISPRHAPEYAYNGIRSEQCRSNSACAKRENGDAASLDVRGDVRNDNDGPNGTQLLILYPFSRSGYLSNFAMEAERNIGRFMRIENAPVIEDGEVWDSTRYVSLLNLHVRSSLTSLHGAELPASVSPVLRMLFAIDWL
jgi:hypothetical protein